MTAARMRVDHVPLNPRTQVACEALDVRAAGGEQTDLVLLAPGRVLAQVQLVGLAGQAAVPG